MRSQKPILVVEDDSVDAMTVKRAFGDACLFNKLIHKKSAEDALAFLRDPRNEKPCIILLDLNMPRMNGIEFLEITKQDSDLRRIPTIVLTTSREDRDKSASFRRNIAGYIVKPIEYPQFVEAIRTVDSYWTLNRFPE